MRRRSYDIVLTLGVYWVYAQKLYVNWKLTFVARLQMDKMLFI